LVVLAAVAVLPAVEAGLLEVEDVVLELEHAASPRPSVTTPTVAARWSSFFIMISLEWGDAGVEAGSEKLVEDRRREPRRSAQSVEIYLPARSFVRRPGGTARGIHCHLG
jgi:hypothetical protein